MSFWDRIGFTKKEKRVTLTPEEVGNLLFSCACKSMSGRKGSGLERSVSASLFFISDRLADGESLRVRSSFLPYLYNTCGRSYCTFHAESKGSDEKSPVWVSGALRP
jgi:hypothetical protein